MLDKVAFYFTSPIGTAIFWVLDITFGSYGGNIHILDHAGSNSGIVVNIPWGTFRAEIERIHHDTSVTIVQSFT